MRRKKKEFIRINLNKKKSFLETLKSLDLSTLKETYSENLLPILFLVSVAVLVIVLLINLYMRKKVSDLNEELAAAREKKDRILAQINALRAKIKRIEFERKLTKYLKEYNRSILKELREVSNMPSGVIVQNISLCARLDTKGCDINRANEIYLDKPILQVDVVAFKDNIDLNNYELRRQTYIEIGGIPVKRFCLEKKEAPEKNKKK